MNTSIILINQMAGSNKVGVIIVLYYADVKQIKSLLDVLRKECLYIILIDNTPNLINKDLLLLSIKSNKKIYYLPQQRNLGIAEAQNIGIRLALSIKDVTHVMLLDQDSVIYSGFVNWMYEEYFRIFNLGIKISALGPTPININSKTQYKQESVSLEKRGQGFYSPSLLISSGMFIGLKTLEDVGLMESGLFIDAVDFEWCWRAKSKGYVCCMTDNVFMKHKVGIHDRCFFGYTIIISSPIRYYYQYRNFMLLLNRSYVPASWKHKNLIKKFFLMIYLPLFSENGFKSFSYMVKGMKDGFKKVGIL